MKRFRKTKEKVLGFVLALVMVVSVIAGGNMFEVKAESSNTYTPYYDATNNRVCGIEVGDIIYPTTSMNIDSLGDDILFFAFYENEEDIEGECWDSRQFSKADEKLCNEKGIEYSYTIGDNINGNYDKALGWIVNEVYYNAHNKWIGIHAVAIDKADSIETAILTFDWTKFKVSESLEESENNYEFWITMSGTGVKESEDPYRYLRIKATQEHVDAGYISAYALQNVGADGYLSIWDYSDDYKIGAKDEIKYSLEISTQEGYAFTDETNVQLVGKNVQLDGVWLADSNFSKNTRLLLSLSLGTGADIEEAINASTQAPPTPPTTSTINDHKAELENKADVETKIELTEDEKSAIASGEDLEVVLVFTDAGTKVDNDEKKAIEKQLGENTLGVFLDIELIKKIGSTEVEVSETKGLVTITFEMPDELKNKDASVTRTYKVMRYHDGKVDVLDAKYDSKTGKLSFETDKFSTYAIVYSDAKTNSTTTSTPAPQTGDATNTFVYIALLGLALCSVVLMLRKQRKF